MQLWPFYMAITGALAAVTWLTDRQAFISYVAVLCGLVAMRWAVSMPFFLGPLTTWTTVAVIVIYTNPSILAGVFALLIPLPYLFAVAGWPASHAYFWSDVAGLGLLLALAIPSGLVYVDSWRSSALSRGLGLDCARIESPDLGALRSWSVGALAALGKAQAGATPEAIERVSGD